MGYYNVSCGLSNLTIDSEMKSVVFLLVPSIIKENQYKDYTLLSLPIVGYYNQQGSLENIEENCHTKALEKFFNKSIYEILDFVSAIQNRDTKLEEVKIPVTIQDSRLEFLTKVRMMFGLYDVYEYISSLSKETYLDSNVNIFYLSFLDVTLVKSKSLIKNLNVDKDDNSYFYQVKGYPDIWIKSNEFKSEVYTKNRICGGLYKMSNLNNLWVKLTGKELIPDTLKTKSIHEINYMLKQKEDNLPSRLPMELCTEESLTDSYSQDPCRILYNEIYNDSEFKELLIKHKKFNDVFFFLNRFYQPTIHNGQFGDYNIQSKLYKFCSNYVDDIYKKQLENESLD